MGVEVDVSLDNNIASFHGGGVEVTPIFPSPFFQLVKIRLHTKNQRLALSGSSLKVWGGFHSIMSSHQLCIGLKYDIITTAGHIILPVTGNPAQYNQLCANHCFQTKWPHLFAIIDPTGPLVTQK